MRWKACLNIIFHPIYVIWKENQDWIVNLLLNGVTASFLSGPCGESSRTLSSWVKQVDEGGFEALRPKKQPGRPHRLAKEQKDEIKEAILSEPSAYGYNVWDGPSLSDFILKQYQVVLGVRQCQRLFHELGFSQIRPQAFPSKDREEDPNREEFKKNWRLTSPRKRHELNFRTKFTLQWRRQSLDNGFRKEVVPKSNHIPAGNPWLTADSSHMDQANSLLQSLPGSILKPRLQASVSFLPLSGSNGVKRSSWLWIVAQESKAPDWKRIGIRWHP